MKAHVIEFHRKEDEPTYEMIKSKIIDHAEIVVNFFDHCNMRCVFCPQDHESKVGATREDILAKVPIIVNYLRLNSKTDNFLLHVMGGELFQDEFIDEGFLGYYSEFIEQLEAQKPPHAILNFNFITNLIFTRRKEMMDFINKHSLDLAISYDPSGRFNARQFELFKENIELFKDRIRMVSLGMTNVNIDKLVNHKDPYFDYLYDLYDMYFDHLLVGDEKSASLMPTEKEMYQLYCLLLDKYPKVMNVQQFQDKSTKKNKMSCTRGNSLTVFADNSVPMGCSGSVVLKNNKTEDNWSTKIIDNFLTENMCLTCEYYQRCNLTCFVHNDYGKMVKDIEGCVYKRVFEYADSSNRA